MCHVFGLGACRQPQAKYKDVTPVQVRVIELISQRSYLYCCEFNIEICNVCCCANLIMKPN